MSIKVVRNVMTLLLLGGLTAGLAVSLVRQRRPAPARRVIDVHPGEDIQAALERAADAPAKTVVRVHPGTYRPAAPAQALIHFNARHDGVTVEAVGEVILTAANPAIADRRAPSYPAVVNHVVYFGDGISRATVFRGFRITGANGFVQGPADLPHVATAADLEKSFGYTSVDPSPIEANDELSKIAFFFTDGAGILVYGRSFPTLEDLEVFDNTGSLCGAGLSVQHFQDELRDSVLVKDCVFRGNRAAASGSAADLLTPYSWATFENCLFLGNVSDARIDASGRSGYGALTVFPRCRATVRNCTFTGNSAGVDDRGSGSEYRDSIFWHNDRPGGINPLPRYELDIADASRVTACLVHGATDDVRANVSASRNAFDPPDPDFDADLRPRHERYRAAGYRPVRRAPPPARDVRRDGGS